MYPLLAEPVTKRTSVRPAASSAPRGDGGMTSSSAAGSPWPSSPKGSAYAEMPGGEAAPPGEEASPRGGHPRGIGWQYNYPIGPQLVPFYY